MYSIRIQRQTHNKNYWEVAQLVEQRTLNAQVAGSNPALPAKLQLSNQCQGVA